MLGIQICKIMLLAIGFSMICATASAQYLAAKEIVDLVDASLGQAVTLQYTAKRQDHSLKNGNPELIHEAEFIVRRTPTRFYSEMSLEGEPGERIVFGDQWSKRYVSTAESNRLWIFPGDGDAVNSATSRQPLHIDKSLREPFGFQIQDFMEPETKVEFDTSTNVYRLSRTQTTIDGDFASVMSVDPAIGYMPISYEWIGPDGSLQMEQRFSNWREAEDGGWLPNSYEFNILGQAQLKIAITISNIQVNTPMSDEELDIIPADGTLVIDHISHLRYVVGEEEKGVRIGEGALNSALLSDGSPGSDRTGIVVPSDLRDAEIATEESLSVLPRQEANRQPTSSFFYIIVPGISLGALGWFLISVCAKKRAIAQKIEI